MSKEEIIEAISNATGGTFAPIGVCQSTCMAFQQEYDRLGRPLRADPNYISGNIVIEGVQYALVKKGWKSYIFKPEYPDANYTWLWRDDVDQYILATIDLTPQYIKDRKD